MRQGDVILMYHEESIGSASKMLVFAARLYKEY